MRLIILLHCVASFPREPHYDSSDVVFVLLRAGLGDVASAGLDELLWLRGYQVEAFDAVMFGGNAHNVQTSETVQVPVPPTKVGDNHLYRMQTKQYVGHIL